ncbi:sodium-dependent bicarbonate transport family permease [Ramlibacter sp. AW1]|uniref:Sodium-dependent bicarbonate transport family permease n=1 Tax=Ramlibacter aurantiacus TaxID=2801330 RepID=A0A936ZN00_9BURK|nr:sodium-dependent bicarbonate transport family permease [Ramlibacter aurantiacus]MBL0422732.1 sodium-dependent bicarbonate transport family permease [Ramlibacter aurantiacus]
MNNLLDPALLFFILGVTAGALRSNLEIPQPIAKFLSLYLLMALGLKGGFALSSSGFSATVAVSLLAALTMAALVPMLGYAFLRRHVGRFDAAAIAASYGSVSAVTFVTAMQSLESQGLAPGGHMAAAMVVMESPAVIFAVLVANSLRQRQAATAHVLPGTGAASLAGWGGGHASTPIGKILHESFTDGAQLLLLGAMAIGYFSGDAGKAVMQPFAGDLFKGMLAFFLLDMGLLVARHFGSARQSSPVLLAYAVLAPLVHASLALLLAALVGMPAGDAALLMVLSASASYIVVPAVLRNAIPEANPSLYFGLSLGVTFPLNLMVGIPLYTWAARTVL